MSKTLSIWQDQAELTTIQETYGKDLTQTEWNIFMKTGLATGLNPFLKEIWAVKFRGKPAQIFVGRDGYRKSAQTHKHYGSHTVDAVYENDTFDVNPSEGIVNHKYTLKDRGALVGAYCLIERKSGKKSMYNWVSLKEYMGHDKSLWGTKPETMIKKVAEAQGLRGAFQELFAGTYEESEDWKDNAIEQPKYSSVNVEVDKNSNNSLGIAQESNYELITDAQIKKYNTVWGEYYAIYGQDKEKNPDGLDKTDLRKSLIKKITLQDSLTTVRKSDAITMIDGLEKAVAAAPAKPKVVDAETVNEVFKNLPTSQCCIADVEMKDGKPFCSSCGVSCAVQTMTEAERKDSKVVAAAA